MGCKAILCVAVRKDGSFFLSCMAPGLSCVYREPPISTVPESGPQHTSPLVGLKGGVEEVMAGGDLAGATRIRGEASVAITDLLIQGFSFFFFTEHVLYILHCAKHCKGY